MFMYTFSNCYEGSGRPRFIKGTFKNVINEILKDVEDSCIHIYEIDCESAKIIKEYHYKRENFLNKFAPKGYVIESVIPIEGLKIYLWEESTKIESYSEFSSDWDEVIYIYKKVKEE